MSTLWGWLGGRVPGRDCWGGMVWLLAVASILGTGGCREPTARVDLWVLRESAIPSPQPGSVRAESRAWHDAFGPVEIAGAINETISFRFAIHPRSGPIRRPDLTFQPLSSSTGKLSGSVVEIFRVHRVAVPRWPGWHIRALPPDYLDSHPLDVLVPIRAPRGGLPSLLEAGGTYYFWVDLSIPRGTAGGSYHTNIELTADNKLVGQLAVDLTVWPFVLPDEGAVPLIAQLDHRSLFAHHIRYQGRSYCPSVDDWREDALGDEMNALLQSTVRLLRSHGLTPVLPRLSPLVQITATDDVILDWGQFDATVEPLLGGHGFFNRVPLRAWPMPLAPILSDKAGGCLGTCTPVSEIALAYLGQCADHFAQQGWLDRSYAVLGPASPLANVDHRVVDRVAELARAADGRIPILLRLFPQDLRPYGWVDYVPSVSMDAADIWMPSAQFYSAEVMADQRLAGQGTWMAIDRPPFSGTVAISARPQDVRILARQAQALGAEALFLGWVNHWPRPEGSPSPADCVRHDPGVLLYPGGPFGLNEPVSSARLRYLRQSVQDSAYDRLLSEHGLDHVARTLREALSLYGGTDAYRTHFADGRPIGWPHDPTLFTAARDIMARELLAVAYAKKAESRSEALVRTTAWRQFMLATRRIGVHVDGVRVRMIGPSATSAAEVECALTVENRTRTPLAGTIRFVELPEGWTARPHERTFPEIAPNSSARLRLTALASVIPTTPGGFLHLPLELETADGDLRRFNARMSCVFAPPVSVSPRIDGDLADWPAGATNVASDFILISGPPGDRSKPASVCPGHATRGFVMRDTNSLYFGINCEIDPNTTPPQRRRKSVQYDDLIPVGEELVEILLDPYNTGTRSPTDLFHIVVKFGGSDLAEKGVRLDPPCGMREPWPADLEVGTKISADRWSAEVRVPFSAFGAASAEGEVWGFNITRFDLARQEFSTWSGAAGNAYDPLSLGNLHLP